jgi:hypothetical protein
MRGEERKGVRNVKSESKRGVKKGIDFRFWFEERKGKRSWEE